MPTFLSSIPNWVPQPPLTHKQVLLPPLGPGGDAFACRGGGWGTQFRRRNRHSGTLMYTIIPLRWCHIPLCRHLQIVPMAYSFLSLLLVHVLLSLHVAILTACYRVILTVLIACSLLFCHVFFFSSLSYLFLIALPSVPTSPLSIHIS